MRLQQLRYIIAIAESGSINAAAHSLFVSQSSLSVIVHDLERELGVQIFERSSRGISLTSDGVEFLGYARQEDKYSTLLCGFHLLPVSKAFFHLYICLPGAQGSICSQARC